MIKQGPKNLSNNLIVGMTLKWSNISKCDVKITNSRKIADKKLALNQVVQINKDKKFWTSEFAKKAEIFSQFFGPVRSEADMQLIN